MFVLYRTCLFLSVKGNCLQNQTLALDSICMVLIFRWFESLNLNIV